MNMLMILADQHNARLMGCAGHPQAITPNLDRLAAEGVRFTNAYTQNTICTPSRVSILSGQYCHNHRVYGLSGSCNRALPNLFRATHGAGFRTAAFGKLHLPNEPRNWIADDVDLFDDAYEDADGRWNCSPFLRHLEELGLRDVEDSWHNASNRYSSGAISEDAGVSALPYEHTHEYWHMQRLLTFIDQEPDTPFCVQLSMQKPHHPLLPQQQFLDMYPEDMALPETVDVEPVGRPPHFQAAWREFRDIPWEHAKEGESWRAGVQRSWRATLACITQIDDVIGRLLEGLKQRGKLEDTVIVYGADHGCYHSIHGIREKAPGICSGEVCRVPMIWRLPGVLQDDAFAATRGTSCDALVENVDMTPTLLSLCALEPLETADGLDISRLLCSPTPEPVHAEAVTENVLSKSIRWDRYRYVHYPRLMFNGEDHGELYDIESDPQERHNLYRDPAYANVVEEARRRLMDWLISTTRVCSVQPPANSPDVERSRYCFPQQPTAADGSLATRYQPRFCRDEGNHYY